MRVLFDGRSLQSPVRSGIPRVAAFWLQQLVHTYGAGNIDILTTGWTRRHIETYGARQLHVRLPNKFLHAMLFLFRSPGLERIAAWAARFHGLSPTPYSRVYVPNLHFFASTLPYTLLVHDLSFLQIPWMYSWFERFVHALKCPRKLIAYADQIFTVSHSSALDLARCCGRAGVQILDIQGLALLSSAAIIPVPVSARRDFIFISTTETRKNLESAILGFIAFQQQHPQLHTSEKLIIVGAITRAGRKLQHMYAKHRYIVWLGAVDDDTRDMLLARAKALLYPSFYEGFGIPLLEAQRMGTPIITSYATSMPEVAPKAILIDPTRTNCVQQALNAVFVLYSAHE